jgi:hypothetical protein
VIVSKNFLMKKKQMMRIWNTAVAVGMAKAAMFAGSHSYIVK